MNRRNFIKSVISGLSAFLFLGKSDDFVETDFEPKNITVVSSEESGQWYHICVVCEGDTPTANIRWYVNGKEVDADFLYRRFYLS